MISGKDLYHVIATIVPLYVAMLLGFVSVKWWKIFTPEQCAGINRFVAVLVVPLLSFEIIASNDLSTMNFRFIAGDSLQKVVVLVALFLWQTFSKSGSLEWTITQFSLSTLPNNLLIGIPTMTAMYGEMSRSLMVQIVVFQGLIWYNLVICMFEFRAAKLFIAEQFPETAGSINSFKVESDVLSLNGHEPLQADANIAEGGKLHVVVRRETASSRVSSSNKSLRLNSISSSNPRASNLTGAEIYSVQFSGELMPWVSSFNKRELYPMFESKSPSPKHGNTNSCQWGLPDFFLHETKPRSTLNVEEIFSIRNKKRSRSMSGEVFKGGQLSSYPPPDLKRFGSSGSGLPLDTARGDGAVPNKDLHMFVWSTSTPRVPEANISLETSASGGEDKSPERESEEGMKFTRSGSQYSCRKPHQMPPTAVVTRLVLIMVWRKLIRNPNTYASVLGLVWSIIASRCHVKMPTIVEGSISIMSKGGLGMAQFSLGSFMALQPKFIACGKSMAAFSMVVRFLIGPAVIAATSSAIRIHGVLFQIIIVQAALPLAIGPFVFAKEYGVHPEIISTAIIFGLLLAVPVALLYYVLLGL